MNEITIGSKTVQQKVISWSYLIRGNEARYHIKVKIIIHDFIPKVIAFNHPTVERYKSILYLYILSI